MDKLKKILFAITMIFGAINLFAMDQPDQTENKATYRDLELGQTSNNDCCHWCRKSINRESRKAYNFKGCLKCKMSFCGRENCAGGIDPFSKEGCRVCLGICCCCYEDCLEDHQHCFTAKRTYQRHSENEYSWTKNRKTYPEPKSSPKTKRANKKRERLGDGDEPELKKQKVLSQDSNDSIGSRVVLSRRTVSRPQSKVCSQNAHVNLQLYLISSMKKNNNIKLDKEVEIPSNEIFLGIEVDKVLIENGKVDGSYEEIAVGSQEVFVGIEVKNNLVKSNIRPDLAVFTEEQVEIEVEEDPEIAYLEAEIFRAFAKGPASRFINN